jgi:peptidoglycan/xylan/chitin deacetylase (PgdA/CDA1 family)
MAGQWLNKAALGSMYFFGLSTLARPIMGGIGAILMLHRVRPREAGDGFAPNAHLAVTPKFLDRMLHSLGRSGYEFVSMDEVAARLSGESTARSDFIAVTLDDGYRDNLEFAVPIFHKHKVPFAIYVAPGLVDGKAELWWEDLEALIRRRSSFILESPRGNIRFDVASTQEKRDVYAELLEFLTNKVSEDDQRQIVRDLNWQRGYDPAAHCREEIMGWAEIAGLAADPLCTIGAHTIHHFALARLDAERAGDEIEQSARILELELGMRPRHFAFPYGYPAAAGPREFELAKAAGFATAVTTRHGVVTSGHREHRHALPRISLNGLFQQRPYVHAMLSGLPTRLVNRGRALNVG